MSHIASPPSWRLRLCLINTLRLTSRHSEHTPKKYCHNCVWMRKMHYQRAWLRHPIAQVLSAHISQSHTSVRWLKTDRSSQSFVNPILELQRFVSVPILSKEQAVFSPTDAEIAEAAKIFRKTKGRSNQNAGFIGSFVDGGEVPDLNVPQICFLGRSNVGKSSLISFLLKAHPQVYVSISKQPGHTRKLNVYGVGQHFALVDMPGYGYNMPRNFQRSVENYLNNSRSLSRTFLLVDGEVGLSATDNTALNMLKEFGIPFVVVLTKIDKVGRHKLLQNVMKVMEVCSDQAGHTCFSQPFLVSSKSGDGMLLLQTFIAYVTGTVRITGL